MKLPTAASVISAMWNHAPAMEEGAESSNIAWLRFKKGEMRELIAYIQSPGEEGK